MKPKGRHKDSVPLVDRLSRQQRPLDKQGTVATRAIANRAILVNAVNATARLRRANRVAPSVETNTGRFKRFIAWTKKAADRVLLQRSSCTRQAKASSRW